MCTSFDDDREGVFAQLGCGKTRAGRAPDRGIESRILFFVKSKKRAAGAPEAPPFERVWRLVRRVPRGKVVTYGQLSQWIDRRLTPVGVGWAVRAAPEGSIPWQRVINARGGISTDREHAGLQRAMLEAEGVRFSTEGTVDLARYGWAPRGTR